MQNKDFISAIDNVKRLHKKKLVEIETKAVILKQKGSETLQKDLAAIVSRSPLYDRPQQLILRSLAVFLLTGVNPNALLQLVETDKEINMIKHPRQLILT